MPPRAWRSWYDRSMARPSWGSSSGQAAECSGSRSRWRDRIRNARTGTGGTRQQSERGAGCRCAHELRRIIRRTLWRAPFARDRNAVVLTPHQGEFSRFSKKYTKISKSNSKLEKARLAAEFCGAVVVYKGADTVVAAPDRRAYDRGKWPAEPRDRGFRDVLAGIHWRADGARHAGI